MLREKRRRVFAASSRLAEPFELNKWRPTGPFKIRGKPMLIRKTIECDVEITIKDFGKVLEEAGIIDMLYLLKLLSIEIKVEDIQHLKRDFPAIDYRYIVEPLTKLLEQMR